MTAAARADELFASRFDANARRVDRVFVYVMSVQWLAAIALALGLRGDMVAAIGLGGLLSGLAIALATWRPGRRRTRVTIAVAQMLWSALLLHLIGDRIEAHAHVLVSLALLALYRDWRVLVPAAIAVVADPTIANAWWIALEDAVLVLSCVWTRADVRAAAEQQALTERSDNREREVASSIQTSILPRTLAVDGLEIAAVMATATEVGGDYYDVLPVDDGCWIGIGDVAGHGLPAGLVMMQTQAAVSALVRHNPAASPQDILVGTNRVLFENIRTRLHHDEHMTMSLLRYRSDGRIVFAGAHEDIVIWRAATRRCEVIETPGTWLGIMPDIRKATVTTRCHLEPDDVMLLYTDGVTEVRNARREQFGFERLCATLETVAGAPVEDIRDHLLATVRAWASQQDDDITLLVARHRGQAENRATAPRSRSMVRVTNAPR